MAKKFTVRVNTTNKGGIYCPITVTRWRILLQVAGDIVELEVRIPSSSCPKEWLARRGFTLDVDALAELIR